MLQSERIQIQFKKCAKMLTPDTERIDLSQEAVVMAQMRAAQEAQRKAREEAYQKAASQQKENYNFATGQVNSAAEDALREAYG